MGVLGYSAQQKDAYFITIKLGLSFTGVKVKFCGSGTSLWAGRKKVEQLRNAGIVWTVAPVATLVTRNQTSREYLCVACSTPIMAECIVRGL